MNAKAIMTSIPLACAFEGMAQESVAQLSAKVYTEINDEQPTDTNDHTNGLIGDLAWILLLGAIVTLLFKKLKQPVVLGYILAGFLASPNFKYLPSISNMENIHFWADLGIVVLMFSLGIEFSFKKLINSGSSAVITALIIITGMTMAGFGVGKLLDLNVINCVFLGGMISMSSTTIILKALTDLGLRKKKFASLVLSVLIIEDLFAVIMLVVLSSMAMGDVKGSELAFSIAKLAFFLIIWFVVGVYVLPSLLNRMRSYLNDETLLVVAMALCFSMAIFSVLCGFSLELGAFVMGSILAGTLAAERIDVVIKPVKDLFGSVFFISVGMMVDPSVISTYWWEILLLAAVVIVGMIIFGTLGMIATGQSLKVAMQSGFSLTQIGEFSFIIASLGMGLGVLESSLYPIIVAVSVITIFTTPYFIKLAEPAYNHLEPHLPKWLQFLINRYSKQTSDANETRKLWRDILSRYVWRVLLYSVVIIAIMLIGYQWVLPLGEKYLGEWGRLSAMAITLAAMSPFLISLSFSSTKPDEKMRLHSTASFYDVPLVALRVIRYLITLFILIYFAGLFYGSTVGWIVGVCLFAALIVLTSSKILNSYKRMEQKFIDNLNLRENVRSGRNNNIIDDLHLAYIEIGPACSFAGDRLKDSGLRRDYGVSVASIQRGLNTLPLPTGDARIFPGDLIGVIGTDDQIQHLNNDLESEEKTSLSMASVQPKVELKSIRLTKDSPIIGKSLTDTDIRHDFYSMIVKIFREQEGFIQPGPDTILKPGDIVWVVGDPSRFDNMK
ncbi:MAG: cation:proton antiporter [Muribaculum sp.]|nr:cation:proton antiporter [Muribaculum sp.]